MPFLRVLYARKGRGQYLARLPKGFQRRRKERVLQDEGTQQNENIVNEKIMETIKSYKGFKKDMTCRDFKYEEGKEYETGGNIKACENGFHACERPLDVFSYYPPAESVYHEVEQSGEMSRDSDDSKVASSKIKIGARLDIRGLVSAQIEYVKSHTTTEHTDPKMATAGYRGAATAGYRGAATAGDSGAATAGNYGAATSRGSSSVGENGAALARGNNVKVKGGLGAILVLVEENKDDYGIKNWKAIRIDGKKYLPDTWYTLNDKGKVIKVEE